MNRGRVAGGALQWYARAAVPPFRDRAARADGDPGTSARPPRWRRYRVVAVYAAVALAAVGGVMIGRDPEGRSRSEPPAEVTERLAEARRLAEQGQPAEAINVYTDILAEHPDNTEALAYAGWLVRLAGRASNDRAMVDKGLASIERALAIDSTYAEAHFFRGVILYQDKGDPLGAVDEFRACLDSNPPTAMVPHVERLVDEAMAAARHASR